MKAYTPLGQPAVAKGLQGEPVSVMVARSPLGLCLFLRWHEIPHEPFYGPDEDGWVGYLFPPGTYPATTPQELFNWGVEERVRISGTGPRVIPG